ncbi:MAG TPA: ABC transporter permease [Acidimicrobiia bacterium]|nr:ABC transporter permease [Acidimicrobiia bacterium]
MHAFLGYTFSGLITASIYAVAASGLVLTYTTTGVFNFAHGAIGMVAAFAYWDLRFGWNLPAPIALIVTLFVLAPIFGAFIEVVIMRNLQGTSETTKLVATLSLLVALLGLSLWIWDPNKARPIRSFWQGNAVSILGVRLSWHECCAFLIAIAVAIGLRLLLYRTRIGVSMRAAVDDRPLAQLNGARPDAASMLAWAIGCSLAALSGILISPTLLLSALPLTLLIVNAYAAAMFGRLRSLPMTFVGALVLGLAADYSRGYIINKVPSNFTPYLTGLVASVPIILLFIILLVLPGTRLRGHGVHRTRENLPKPTWSGTAFFAAAMVVGAAMMTLVIGRADLNNVNRMWGLAIIALSMVPLIGYAGQISLCQLSFGAIGAVVMAHLGGVHGNPLALLLGGVVAAAVGALIALPALRLSGIYLALATAAFAVMLDRWIWLLPKFTIFHHSFDIFQQGSLTISRVGVFGYQADSDRAYFIFGAIMFGVFALLVAWIRRSGFGHRLLAMKDSPAACATLGLNLTFTKVAVFAISAFIAGIGGAIYGGALRVADSSQTFDFFTGLSILLVMVIAGIGSLGAAFSTGFFLGAPILANLFPSLKQLQTVLVGFAGIGLGQNPNGFIQKDIRPRYNVMVREPLSIVALVVAMIITWLLRTTGIIANYPFAIIELALLALGPQLGEYLARRRRAPEEIEPGVTPLEWVGITEPFTADRVAEMDRALGLGDGEAVAHAERAG